MPRRVEDIIHTEPKRSIRDIPVPINRRKLKMDPRPIPRVQRRAEDEIVVPITVDPEPVVDLPLPKSKRFKFQLPKKRGLWFAILFGGVVLTFSVLSLMRSAVLSYEPKSAPLSFNKEVYTAYKTGGSGILLFSVVKLTDDKGATVPATGETEVTKFAKGTVLIYNNTTGPQQLIKTTRLETADGKVYRIQSDLTVPGKTSSGPGSVEVLAVSDKAGSEFNIGLSDFTLPGLKGTPKFTTIYARSKTSMTGGARGVQKVVSEAGQQEAEEKLKEVLRAQLVAEATAQVPADFILFPDLSTTIFESLPQSGSTDTSVNVNIRGNFYGVIFKRSDLTSYLKFKKLAVLESQNIVIPELEKLQLTFVGGVPEDLLKANQISFDITGEARALWVTDENLLKKALAGNGKSELSTIMVSFPSVTKAEAIIRPFWKSTFPEDPSEITLKEGTLK